MPSDISLQIIYGSFLANLTRAEIRAWERGGGTGGEGGESAPWDPDSAAEAVAEPQRVWQETAAVLSRAQRDTL
eukprot:1743502-Pleurochrysis_carterae.AAC.7